MTANKPENLFTAGGGSRTAKAALIFSRAYEPETYRTLDVFAFKAIERSAYALPRDGGAGISAAAFRAGKPAFKTNPARRRPVLSGPEGEIPRRRRLKNIISRERAGQYKTLPALDGRDGPASPVNKAGTAPASLSGARTGGSAGILREKGSGGPLSAMPAPGGAAYGFARLALPAPPRRKPRTASGRELPD